MTGASRNNEGKIHLGILFALDTTLRTQRTMLRGALTFAPLLDQWLGPQPWDEWRTDPIRTRSCRAHCSRRTSWRRGTPR